MRLLIRLFAAICLLRAAPQDLPASRVLLVLALGGYLLLTILLVVPIYGLWHALGVAVLDTTLQVVFIAVLLKLLRCGERVLQTLTAQAGCSCLLGVLAIPLVFWGQPSRTADPAGDLLLIAWLMLLVWNLLVAGHILRHALSTSLATGVGVSLLYSLASSQLVTLLFPYQAV